MNPQNENCCAHMDAVRAFGMIVVLLANAGRGKIVRGRSGFTVFFSLWESIITYLMLHESEQKGGFRIEAYYIRRALKVLPPLIVCVMAAPDRAHFLVVARGNDS